MPFDFTRHDQERIALILAAWRSNNHCGQLIGPHGCGKSALADQMIRQWNGQPERTERIVIRKRGSASSFERRLGLGMLTVRRQVDGSDCASVSDAAGGSDFPSLLLIDGLDRLPPIARIATGRFLRHYPAAILITNHRALPGVPVLDRMQPCPRHFLSLVDGLIQRARRRGWDGPAPDPGNALNGFRNCNRNYREAFLRLYDWVQQRSS